MTEKQAIYCELLVLRCQQGMDDAIEELIRTWEKRLFYFIRRLIDDEQEAWQVLQETWICVLRGIRRLRQPRKLPVWLYSIARKTALYHIRSRYSEQARLKEAENSGRFEDSSEDLVFENAELVHYGLNKIPVLQREVLTLFFMKELSINELSEVLGVPVGTVKSRLYYAKRALRAALHSEVEKR